MAALRKATNKGKGSHDSNGRRQFCLSTQLGCLVLLWGNKKVVQAQDQPLPTLPQLNGAHFQITALQENGFLDVQDDGTSDAFTEFSFSGYLIDMIEAIAQPQRANFTYTLKPPSGLGSKCVPQLSLSDAGNIRNSSQQNAYHPQAYAKDYRTQYNCGTSDVNDAEILQTNYSSDMYLGMYYLTPSRQLDNQFTIPFLPPFSGTLAMFGTATGIPNFEALVEQQTSGVMDPSKTCGPGGSALIDFVVQSYPGLQVRGLFGGEDEIYQAFVDQSCQVYIIDGPIAAQFVLRRARQDQCMDVDGMPIGVIGDPMDFGLSHYAIGIRRDIPKEIVDTISYWMNILMTCNPLDLNGQCPEGNFATFYEGRGGTGEECGYVLYPVEPNSIGPGAIAGIVIASVVFALALYTVWHKYRLRHQKRVYAEQSRIAIEKAEYEREFNQYMAHEVRNPLASALAALSFVSSKTVDPAVVPDEENRALIKEDVAVVDSSLQFVNELLRNMLDLHRTNTGHDIKLTMAPTDIYEDILVPVSTILFMRGAPVEIQTDCPPNLFIMGDRMRLKQVLLNLAQNSTKFVQQGFIRLRAEIIEGSVNLYVEDSGPGLPKEKRTQIFTKFQESLDVLNQGTGIGLAVCQNLSTLMGGELGLDDDFDSGITGCPGTRFRLKLNQAPLEHDTDNGAVSGYFHDDEEMSRSLQETLPTNMSVLFVDDDMMLRKMFSRVLKLAAPSWKIREASNGETALKVVDEEEFGIIFIDQYMAAVEKQLLGTDVVQAMRAKGVKSIICGLSANDLEENFINAGANAFMSKPFPCKKEALHYELHKMCLSQAEQSPVSSKAKK